MPIGCSVNDMVEAQGTIRVSCIEVTAIGAAQEKKKGRRTSTTIITILGGWAALAAATPATNTPATTADIISFDGD